MKLTKYFFQTVKEAPGDADIESQKLFMKANFIKKLSPGIYSYLPLALRSIRKFENIVRQEMDKSGANEILMPMVQPKELWDETGRYEVMGKGLARFKDRNDHWFCLGATHEEVVTDIVRKTIQSYRDLPFNLYQIQTKFRDEIRPRFGLMRGKEFIMKDAYSFDVNKEAALKSYDVMYNTYKNIFKRCGLEFRIVKADAGAIGGSITHEFQVLAQSGEDQIMACQSCEYASNIEITPAISEDNPITNNLNEASFQTKKINNKTAIHTPNLKTIEDLAKFLKVKNSNLAKTLFYKTSDKKFICVMVCGDDELNEIKLKNHLGLSAVPEMCHAEEIKQITNGASAGSCGPVGLNIQILCDNRLKALKNWVVGANIDDYHFININEGTDFKATAWVDLRKAQEGDSCPECKAGKLKSFRGIEVGHVFFLGDKYSKAMKAQFLDVNGKAQYCEMGCYGIGITRTVQAAIEQGHDKDGMIWPITLAPFEVLITLIDVEDAQIKSIAEELYQALLSKGIEVLLDDRNERPGSKFKDADLIGIPLRINIGKKSFADGFVEMVERKTKKMEKIKHTEVLDKILTWVKEEKKKCLTP
ncbi:MAG: proline--tRNA ligase [Oligoflexia bacterium]|nr:proline--tRNA ligase [Oligoflexia bacterium]